MSIEAYHAEKIDKVEPKKEVKKCLECESTENLSTDHIIPKWFFRAHHLFTGKKVNLQEKKRNKQILCIECNLKKGGRLDYKDTTVKAMAKDIIETILKEI